MLTEQEIEAIRAEAAHYEQPRAACIEALKVVQRHRGWISDENLRQVAGLFGMTTAELDAVATFYSRIYRKPVGRHVILVCNSVSCWIMGGDSLLSRLRERLGIGLGETTADGRFTLLPQVCLGDCHKAPALMIDDDLHDDLHDDLTPEALDRLLAGYD